MKFKVEAKPVRPPRSTNSPYNIRALGHVKEPDMSLKFRP
jgi:hypothetical protein